ncbi:MAG: N-acetyl-gamma-glutamyl-phosphate reductase [Betaproteobacteria bacterium]
MHTTLERRADARGAAASGHPIVRAAVAGATGYAGQELVRLLARHPAAALTAAMASTAAGSHRPLPALAHVWSGAVEPLDVDVLARAADVVFLALPDRAAADLAPRLCDAGVRVIDLSGAFRLRDEAGRARWYPDTGRMPEGIVYGLTERARAEVAGARAVANPGCYPTAALLALAPLVDAGLLRPGSDIVVDAKSGVSGAGKTPSERTHFSECHGSVSAYGVFEHRHAVEIEQAIARPGPSENRADDPAGAGHHGLTFVPHLVPLDRGILSTIYVRLTAGQTEDTLAAVYERAYAGARFVRLTGSALPEIKHVTHTNCCDIGWRVDRSGRAVIVSAIDNLLKGAAGQAVQNMNVMLGLPEETGLL